MWGMRRNSKTTRAWGIQSHHEKGPIQAQARNQKEVGSQGSALDVEETASVPSARYQKTGAETCRKR